MTGSSSARREYAARVRSIHAMNRSARKRRRGATVRAQSQRREREQGRGAARRRCRRSFPSCADRPGRCSRSRVLASDTEIRGAVDTRTIAPRRCRSWARAWSCCASRPVRPGRASALYNWYWIGPSWPFAAIRSFCAIQERTTHDRRRAVSRFPPACPQAAD